MHLNPRQEVSLGGLARLTASHAGLGTSMTHHIRRLFMSPLPAFEGEMAAHGGSLPPAVLAGSKCLAICIEVSQNHTLDLADEAHPIGIAQ